MTRVVLFGDSVFAGYGLDPEDGPAQRLAEAMPRVEVTAVAGPDRTAEEGLGLAHQVEGDVVLVEFGLNDAMDGVPVEATEQSLAAIASGLKARGALVVIIEARVPEGSKWPARVDHAGLAQRVAEETDVVWTADILALAHRHFQDDGLHPDAEGARKIVKVLAGEIARSLSDRTR